jgi:hypothetical protein
MEGVMMRARGCGVNVLATSCSRAPRALMTGAECGACSRARVLVCTAVPPPRWMLGVPGVTMGRHALWGEGPQGRLGTPPCGKAYQYPGPSPPGSTLSDSLWKKPDRKFRPEIPEECRRPIGVVSRGPFLVSLVGEIHRPVETIPSDVIIAALGSLALWGLGWVIRFFLGGGPATV